MNIGFILPTRILAGENCVKNNAGKLTALGKKPLIVTGAHSAVACGAQQDVIDALEGGAYAVFNGVRQNPTTQSCFDGAKAARAEGCDYIIGIGGGSPLDAAKAIAVLAANPDLDEAGLFGAQWKNPPLPIVCVGTTAGTGSEVTPISVLTTHAGRKKSLRDDRIFPAISFGDYRYTLKLSEDFVKSTAVDALSHCVESYFNRKADELSSQFALRGVELLRDSLKKLAKGGLSALGDEDREKIYHASLYGGLAISVTGTALPHAMGYFLTEDHALSHGFACGVYLTNFLEKSQAADRERAQSFFARTGFDFAEFSDLMTALLASVKVDVTPGEIESLRDRWENNSSLQKPLFIVTPDGATAILQEIFGKN